jgi:nucleotide-sensitive chloride channel 1A
MWHAEGEPARHMSLYYQAIVLHAVSRDTSIFESPCIYLQLDSEHKIASSSSSSNGSATGASASVAASGDGSAPMDVYASAAVAGSSGEGARESEDDGDDDEEVEDEMQELRLVPVGPEPDGAGIDSALDRMFEALSECAALNPDLDADDDDDDDDCDGEDEGEFHGDELAMRMDDSLSPEALLESASPAQLAMLARYDALLDALPTEDAAQPMTNADGRYDDPDEDAGE